MTHHEILGLEATPDRAPMIAAVTRWLRAHLGGEGTARPFMVLSASKGMGKSRMLQTLQRRHHEERAKMVRECGCGGTGWLSPEVIIDRRAPRNYTRCLCIKKGRTEYIECWSNMKRNAPVGLQELIKREALWGEERSNALDRLWNLLDARLLLVDEVGGEDERPAVWMTGFTRFIDARAGKPTIFATNLTATKLSDLYRDSRIIDRLLGEGVSEYHRFEGESWRHTGGAA